jgi:hypothetical protein
MKEIRLKISDIFEIEPQMPDQPRGLAAVTAYVLKHYAFLPQPIAVTVEGDEVSRSPFSRMLVRPGPGRP